MGPLLWFIGALNAVIFYSADLFLSYTLSRLKMSHPAIDDAGDSNVRYSGYDNIGESENIEPDYDATLDPVTAVLKAARNGKEEFQNLFDNIRGSSAGYEEPGADGMHSELRNQGHVFERVLYIFVLVSSIIAPVFCLVQILFPSSVAWSMWSVPSWLGYIVGIPGLMISIFYAARAVRIGTFAVVTKVQWLSYSWFRLDVMCVMGLVLLLGWGNWFVALSIYITCFYFTYRLMWVERRLQNAQSTGQLMGDGHAVTIEPVMAGIVRGAIRRGYQEVDCDDIDDMSTNMPNVSARNVYGAAKMTISPVDASTENFPNEPLEIDSKKKKKKKSIKDQSERKESNEMSE